VHSEFRLQQTKHSGDAFCKSRERVCKNGLPRPPDATLCKPLPLYELPPIMGPVPACSRRETTVATGPPPTMGPLLTMTAPPAEDTSAVPAYGPPLSSSPHAPCPRTHFCLWPTPDLASACSPPPLSSSCCRVTSKLVDLGC
jgi:hypothetical protein